MAKYSLIFLALALAGCSTTIRTLSHTYWTSDGAYVAYWEGTCRPMLGCDIGDGKVQWCNLKEDNSMVCTVQDSVSALLHRKAE